MTQSSILIRSRLSILCVCLACALLLTGCNNATSPTDCVNKFTAAMNAHEFRDAFQYVADYDDFGFTSDGSDRIMGAVCSTLIIEILSESGGGSEAFVDVNITSIDLRKAYCEAAKNVIPTYYKQAVSGQTISEAEIGLKLVDEVVRIAQSGNADGVTTKCALHVVKNKYDKWEIVLSTDSYSAITGYLDEANNLITTGAIANEIYGTGIVTATIEEADTSSVDAQ